MFVAPLATVVLAGLAGSWTGALPSDLGLRHFGDALSGENLASLSVSLQTAFIAGGDRAGARHVGGAGGT